MLLGESGKRKEYSPITHAMLLNGARELMLFFALVIIGGILLCNFLIGKGNMHTQYDSFWKTLLAMALMGFVLTPSILIMQIYMDCRDILWKRYIIKKDIIKAKRDTVGEQCFWLTGKLYSRLPVLRKWDWDRCMPGTDVYVVFSKNGKPINSFPASAYYVNDSLVDFVQEE